MGVEGSSLGRCAEEGTSSPPLPKSKPVTLLPGSASISIGNDRSRFEGGGDPSHFPPLLLWWIPQCAHGRGVCLIQRDVDTVASSITVITSPSDEACLRTEVPSYPWGSCLWVSEALSDSCVLSTKATEYTALWHLT